MTDVTELVYYDPEIDFSNHTPMTKEMEQEMIIKSAKPPIRWDEIGPMVERMRSAGCSFATIGTACDISRTSVMRYLRGKGIS